MISLIFKIISGVVSLIFLIISYGIISWNIFGVPTFMSGGKDCKQTAYTNLNSAVKKSESASSFFREGSMFGETCNTK